MARVLRRALSIALLAAGLTCVLTWPIAARFQHSGRIDSGDGRFSIWNVAWVAHALTTDPRHLYDANILHPQQGALAFSEPNILAGVIAVPVWKATNNALAASNFVTLCSFVFSFLAGFALVRHLTRVRTAAVVSAIMFSFSAYAFAHLPHVQLLLTFGLPLCLLALHRFVDEPGGWRAGMLGLALFVQTIACGYYGIFAALAVGWGLVWFAFARQAAADWRYWAWSVLAFGVAAMLIWPFYVPEEQLRAQGFGRTLADARLFSADWRSYLASPMVLSKWMLPWLGTWRDVLFPGFLALGLSALAALRIAPFALRPPNSGLRTPNAALRTPLSRSVVGFYLSLIALALWASFGPDAGLYRVMYGTLPVFTFIRGVSRFGVLVILGFAVLAGIAMADLQQRVRPGRRALVAGALIAAALAEAKVEPLELFDWNRRQPIYRQLSALPDGAVAEFPFFADRNDRFRHTEYMLDSTLHWKPLVNGYTDFIPGQLFDDVALLAGFPDARSWQVLRRRDARYIVVHWDKYQAGDAPREALHSYVTARNLRVIVDHNHASLFEIMNWPL